MSENVSNWYSSSTPNLSDLIESDSSAFQIKFNNEYGTYFDCLTQIMDNTYKLMSHHLWTLNDPYINVPITHTAIGAAIHKNFFVIHSALQLTKSGLYGPARTLLRHTFEFLVVGKFCGVSQNTNVFERWDSGDTVYFTKGILNKIEKPDNSELKFFWNILCKFSHATNSSQQISIDWDNNNDDTYLTLVFLAAMMECQYHLLNSIYITKQMRSMALRYDEDNEIKPIRLKSKELLKRSRSIMNPNLKKLVRTYVATWKLTS